MKWVYRDYTIEEEHRYDNGTSDWIYYHQNDELARAFPNGTIDDIKELIDELIENKND